MIHQKIEHAFADDPDVSRALGAVGRKIAAYSELSRRAAHGTFRTQQAREMAAFDARELMSLIESRARSAGVPDGRIAEFVETARVMAEVAFKTRLPFYPLPDFSMRPATRERQGLYDAHRSAQAHQQEVNEKLQRARRRVAQLTEAAVLAAQEVQLAAHRLADHDAGSAR